MDFLLPRFCPSCNKKLLKCETVICNSCFKTIKTVTPDRIQSEIKRKFEIEKIITDFYSLFVFEKDMALQNIIHSFKYGRRFQNAFYFGELLGEALKERLKLWEIEYIVPVPLHHVKKTERGYNQSFYVAKGLSKNSELPVNNNSIRRQRFTESQTTMSIFERKQNIKDAFKIKKNKNITQKNILLVDDVLTTGATITECGKALLDAGANKIFAATVAIADLNV